MHASSGGDYSVDAVIFDFDGVIADTEALHYRAFQDVLAGRSVQFSWDEYVSSYIGFDDRGVFREAFRRAGISLSTSELDRLIASKAAIFGEITDKEDIGPFPGLTYLVRELEAAVPIAICSGALESDIRPILEAAGLITCFSVMVTAEKVNAGKPDPEGYLLALRLLSEHAGRSLRASDSWAVEDTPDGIQSAADAGLNVLAVTNSHGEQSLKAADRIVSSLESVSLSKLCEWNRRSRV